MPRRELRSNYGTHGVPIREQIVERHDDMIITRNSYGALCLNTPDVLFADMDFEERPSGCVLPLASGAGVLLAGFVVGRWLGGAMFWGFVSAVAALVLANLLAVRIKR